MCECKVYKMREGMEYQCVTEDSEVRVYLPAMRVRREEERKRQFIKEIAIASAQVAYGLLVMALIGKWGIESAYMERGYEAMGGEMFLFPISFWIAFNAAKLFTDSLEEAFNERRYSNKITGRIIPKMQNHRGTV